MVQPELHSLGKHAPWAEAIVLVGEFFTLFLASLIRVKATPFPGIWPVILGKLLKTEEEPSVC